MEGCIELSRYCNNPNIRRHRWRISNPLFQARHPHNPNIRQSDDMLSKYNAEGGYLYPSFLSTFCRQDTLTEDTVDGACLTKPQLVENQTDEVVIVMMTMKMTIHSVLRL